MWFTFDVFEERWEERKAKLIIEAKIKTCLINL